MWQRRTRTSEGSCRGAVLRTLSRTATREHGAQIGDRPSRRLEHVAPGVAAKLVAAGTRLALAATILLPGVA